MFENYRFFLALILLLVMLPACGSSSASPEDAADLETITLQITPSLEHWLQDVADCARGLSDFAILTQIKPPSELDINEVDLILRLGEQQDHDPFVAVMGKESMVILIGEAVPLTSLSLDSLQRIYSGELTTWTAVPELSSQGLNPNLLIQVLSYPDNHELRDLYRQAYLENGPVTSDALVFSTAAFLASLLETNPYAISYTLESLAPTSSQILPITEFAPARNHVHVLAITTQEPSGRLRQLLLCLQQND